MAAMYTTIRDALKQQVETVTATAQVHNRLRYAADWKTYLERFTEQLVNQKRRVHGWWVERESRSDAYHAMSDPSTINERHSFVVYGILGYNDGDDTDSTFGDMVDSVMSAINGMHIAGTWEVGPCTLRRQDLRQFGSVLCHYAEVVTVVEVESTL